MYEKNQICIQRCFDLARLGMGLVSPNPIVGSVITAYNKIIGEGYHMRYGESHAEVLAVKNVPEKKVENFQDTTIFVSLEPCNIHGNTPPCTDLILNNKIPRVVVSAIDKTSGVNFSGIKRLKNNGLTVEHGILQEKGAFLARVRNTFVSKKRPYIILKYAQSKDGFLSKEGQQIWLSNAFSKRLVHKWRTEVQAIMVGTNTVLTDNPKLTARHYPGRSPLRITIDQNERIPASFNLKKDNQTPTWIYTKNTFRESQNSQNLSYKQIKDRSQILQQICSDLYQGNRDTLLVEGGAQLLNSFINAGLWDEARIIKSPQMLHSGIKAPLLKGNKIAQFNLDEDLVSLLLCPNNVIYS